MKASLIKTLSAAVLLSAVLPAQAASSLDKLKETANQELTGDTRLETFVSGFQAASFENLGHFQTACVAEPHTLPSP